MAAASRSEMPGVAKSGGQHCRKSRLVASEQPRVDGYRKSKEKAVPTTKKKWRKKLASTYRKSDASRRMAKSSENGWRGVVEETRGEQAAKRGELAK